MNWGKIKLLIAYIIIISMLNISGCVDKTTSVTPVATVSPTEIPTVTSSPAQPDISIEIINAPVSAVVGKSFDVVWMVNGSVERTISHTAIHYGHDSRVAPLTLSSYPNLTSVQLGTIPSNFTIKMILNNAGTTYFRAHAIVNGVHYWSSERAISVSGSPASIRVFSVPKRPLENTEFTIKWEVSGGTAGNIEKTQILWDYKKSNASNYSFNTTSFIGKTPMEFTTKMKFPKTSTIYFRVQAIVDGIEIFSDEQMVTIYPEFETY